MTSAKPTKTSTKNKPVKKLQDVRVATSNLFVTDSSIQQYNLMMQTTLQELNYGEIAEYGDNRVLSNSGVVNNISNNPLSSSILKSISGISSIYDPKTLLSSTNHQIDYSKIFVYNLENYKPMVGTGGDGSIVYMDENNNLIINTINVADFQEVELEFWIYDQELNDTIIE